MCKKKQLAIDLGNACMEIIFDGTLRRVSIHTYVRILNMYVCMYITLLFAVLSCGHPVLGTYLGWLCPYAGEKRAVLRQKDTFHNGGFFTFFSMAFWSKERCRAISFFQYRKKLSLSPKACFICTTSYRHISRHGLRDAWRTLKIIACTSSLAFFLKLNQLEANQQVLTS